jgi:hypothetical protein
MLELCDVEQGVQRLKGLIKKVAAREGGDEAAAAAVRLNWEGDE